MANGLVDPFGGFFKSEELRIKEQDAAARLKQADVQFKQLQGLRTTQENRLQREQDAKREKEHRESLRQARLDAAAAAKAKADAAKAEREARIADAEERRKEEDQIKANEKEALKQAEELWKSGNKDAARNLIENFADSDKAIALLEASDDDLDQIVEGNDLMRQFQTETDPAKKKELQKQAFKAYGQAGKQGQTIMDDINKSLAAQPFKEKEKAAGKVTTPEQKAKRASEIAGTAAKLKQAKGASELSQLLGIPIASNDAAVDAALEALAQEADILEKVDIAQSIRALKTGSKKDRFIYDATTGTVKEK